MDLIELATNLALQGKYLLLFIAYLIEGPIFGFISAIIASTGQLNIFIVAALLITGEIGADLIYFLLGRYLSESKINKKLRKFEESRVLNALRGVLDKHPVRALVFAKGVAFIAVPTILLIGKYKSMKFGRFFFWATTVCLIKDLTVLFLGFGLGISLESFLGGYDIYRIVGIILALLAVLYIVFRAYRDRIETFTIKALKNIK